MANTYQSIPVPVPAEVAAGQHIECGHLAEKSVVIGGTFTAVVDIQGTLDDPNDSPNWIDISTGVAADDVVAIGGWVRAVRANTTGYTSGTPLAWIAGLL